MASITEFLENHNPGVEVTLTSFSSKGNETHSVRVVSGDQNCCEQSEILIVVPTRNKKNVSKIFDGSITPRIASIDLLEDESSESSGQTIIFPDMYVNQKFVPKTFGHHNDYGDYEGFETQEIKISAGIYTFWIVCLNHCPDYYYSHEFEIKIDGVEYSVEL